MQIIRMLLAAIVFVLWAVPPARAQDAVSVWDVGARGHVQANGGWMVLTTGADWSGASLGGSVLYNLHPQFSIFGGYDHGFPINDVDDHLDLWRAVGSVRIHPNALVGFGYAWFSEGVEGGLAQITLSRRVAPRIYVGGMFAHVFARDDLEDFEYARVYLNYHLLGR